MGRIHVVAGTMASSITFLLLLTAYVCILAVGTVGSTLARRASGLGAAGATLGERVRLALGSVQNS